MIRKKTNDNYSNLILKALLVVSVMIAAFAFSTDASHAASVTGIRQTGSSISSVGFRWNSVTGATRYKVQYSTKASGPFVDASSTYETTPSTYLFNRGAGESIYVRVKAYSGSLLENTEASGWSTPVEMVTAPSETIEPYQSALNNSTTAINLKWRAVSGANYYKIKYYRSTEGLESARTTYRSGTSAILSNL